MTIDCHLPTHLMTYLLTHRGRYMHIMQPHLKIHICKKSECFALARLLAKMSHRWTAETRRGRRNWQEFDRASNSNTNCLINLLFDPDNLFAAKTVVIKVDRYCKKSNILCCGVGKMAQKFGISDEQTLWNISSDSVSSWNVFDSRVNFLRPPVKGWWWANYWDDNLDTDGSPLTTGYWWGKIWPQLNLLLTAVVGRHTGWQGNCPVLGGLSRQQ